jgi:hypothetical protein
VAHGCGIALVVKGVMSAADAASVARLGADGVIVSNHGGRQLDGEGGSRPVVEYVSPPSVVLIVRARIARISANCCGDPPVVKCILTAREGATPVVQYASPPLRYAQLDGEGGSFPSLLNTYHLILLNTSRPLGFVEYISPPIR